jgi:hypothetical protein
MVMVGAKQLGYLRARLRLKKPIARCVVWTDRSLVEPPTRELQLRPPQRIVQALAETLRWFPRVFHCIGMKTHAAARPSQAESQAQRSVSGRKLIPPLVHHAPSAVTPRM